MTTRELEIATNHNHGDAEEMSELDIDALVKRCLLLHFQRVQNQKSRTASPAIFIGIAGTPGSGKSFIAEKICEGINEQHQLENDGKDLAVVIPMDGYHLPRKQLKEMAENGTEFESDQWDYTDLDSDVATKRQLTYEQLMARRGAAFTFCPENFVRDLKKAKQRGSGSFPVYDREKHDPVSDGVRLEQHHKIVLVEGLYLLCLDDPNWAPLDQIFDEKWYVDVSLEEIKRRLVNRHLKTWNEEKTKQFGGSGCEAAAKKAESNDLLNAICIQRHSKQHADYIINNEVVPDTPVKGRKGPEKEISKNESHCYEEKKSQA